MDTLNRKVVKQSNDRLIDCGQFLEHYHYEQPYFYNLPPPARRECAPLGKEHVRRVDNLWSTRQRIRRLITANVGKRPPVFLTLTFRQNVREIREANAIFTNFIKRLKRYAQCNPRYLTVIEFQKRGSIHYHALFFDLPFVDKNILEQKIWAHGYTNIQIVKKDLSKIQNLGAYISKYLQKNLIDQRLYKQKSYFTSRNLIKPQQFRHAERIDEIIAHAKITETYRQEIVSLRYGKIIYNQYKKCD